MKKNIKNLAIILLISILFLNLQPLTSLAGEPETDTIEISGNIKWDHGSNEDFPEEIIVFLGTDVGKEYPEPLREFVVRKDNNNNWEYTFENLPEYDKDNNEINYSVDASLYGYHSTQDEDSYNFSLKFIEPLKIPIDISKTLIGRDIEEGEFEVEIEEKKEEPVQPASIFIPMNTSNSFKIIEKKEEETVQLASIFLPMNTSNSPKIIKIGEDGKGSITLILRDTGQYEWTIIEREGSDPNIVYDDTKYILELNVSNNNGKYEATGTISSNKSDKEITLEHPIKNIEFDFINISKQRDVKVIKKWNDGNNIENKRPKEVEVELLADGEETGKTIKLNNEENNWQDEWTKLKTLDDNKKEIVYTVKENNIPDGYTVNIERNKGNNIQYTITNTYNKKEIPTDPGLPIEPSEPIKPDPINPIPELNKKDHFAYMIGYPEGNFRPEDNITRGEVTTIFFRMLTEESRNNYWSTENNFKDVKKSAWYNNAISTMAKAGVINKDAENFRPNEYMTRAELAVMMTKFFNETGISEYNFTDIKGHWAEKEIGRVAAKGWIDGYEDNSFKPDQPLKRTETAKMINALLERTPDKNKLLDNMIVWPDNNDKNKWYYGEVQEATNSHEYERTNNKSKETWTKLLPVRNWEALEKEWSKANSSVNPGEVNK